MKLKLFCAVLIVLGSISLLGTKSVEQLNSLDLSFSGVKDLVLGKVEDFLAAEPPGFDRSPGGTISGRVSYVSDGDTVKFVSDGQLHNVRLAGIDAPESRQEWGKQSKEALSALVKNKLVTIRIEDVDRYGRLVAQLELGEVNVNQQMIVSGNAWVYRRFNRDRTLIGYEKEARMAGIGLWQLEEPTPPWEWRETRRTTR